MTPRTAGWVAFAAASLLSAVFAVRATFVVGARVVCAPSLAAPHAQIETGKLAGVRHGSVIVFQGVPYAQPPVGSLRWRTPQPAVPWPGLRAARRFGHDCMQHPDPGEYFPNRTVPSEDCLFVNIWRSASGGTRLPVLVYIHGGAYVNGGSSPAVLDGSEFAEDGLVFVNFNYRLGRFGFFAHPALRAAKEGPVGNFGLMDQIAALQWVKHNIAAFGGDPATLTVMGESAGGDAILHLLTSPAAAGLIQRAIVLSGAGREPLSGGLPMVGAGRSAESVGLAFAATLGIVGGGHEALEALRAVPAARIAGGLDIQTLVASRETYAGPMVDGSLVLGTQQSVFLRGQAAAVPLLVGSTSEDIASTLPPSKDRPLSWFGPDEPAAAAVYDPDGTATADQLVDRVGVDMTMHEPARFVAAQMTMHGQPAWLYRFSYTAQALRPQASGAGHATDLAYVFKHLDAMYPHRVAAADRTMADEMHRYFANFARRGDPNGEGLPIWPRFEPADYTLMNFSADRGPVVEIDPLKSRLELVEKAQARRSGAQGEAQEK